MIEKSLAVFENYKIRSYYDEQTEIWYFSVIDIVYRYAPFLVKIFK